MNETEPAKTKENPELEKLSLEIAKLNNWWKKPSYVAALLPAVLVLAALIYGFANGYFQTSFVKAEIADLSRQKEELEQKKARILERLEKARIPVENSKNPSVQVKAHIEVISSTCISCPPPAWIESQREVFAALEEIEKILDEDTPAK